MPVVLFVVAGMSILWPVLQTVQLSPSIFNASASGNIEVNQSLVEPAFGFSQPALEKLSGVSTQDELLTRPARRSISVVRSLTQARIGQWSLMLGFLVLVGLLFDTRKSRKVFFWTIALSAGGLSVWGLIQRSTGTTDLLPGVTKSSVVLPFATFVYKNSGAAALIPGLAACMALFWAVWMPPLRDRSRHKSAGNSGESSATKSSRGSRRGYRQHAQAVNYFDAPWWTRPKMLVLISVAGLITAGLLVSFSRGAWVAVTFSVAATLVLARKKLPARSLLWMGIPLAVCLVLIFTTQLSEKVSERLDGLSRGTVYADVRWEHWQDGFRTAKKYLPFGSGLGTYGYATLAEQNADSRLWFREAHNQYLETLTEQGIPGILIVGLGMFLVLRYAITLLNNKVSRERSAIGLTGSITIIAIATQSVVDFVILIPAVMFLVASVVSVVAHTYQADIAGASQAAAESSERTKPGFARNLISMPAVWIAVVFAVLISAQLRYRDQIAVDKVMDATRLASTSYQPTSAEIETNLTRLSHCIERAPDRADIHQRRATWHLTQFRLALQAASAQQGSEMSWETTSPDGLFQTLMLLRPTSRDTVVQEIRRSAEMREPLAEAIADIRTSIALNPFVPQVHLLSALIAPATGMEHQAFTANLCRLARSNTEFQFAAGLIGYHSGDKQTMVDQWRRSLGETSPLLAQIVRYAREQLSLQEVVTDLIPTDRTVLFLPMVRALSQHDVDLMRSDPSLISVMETRVLADATRSKGQQHGMMALIYQELAADRQFDDAIEKHWQAAVDADGGNSEYRYHYCRILLHRVDTRKRSSNHRWELRGTGVGSLPKDCHQSPTKTLVGQPRAIDRLESLEAYPAIESTSRNPASGQSARCTLSRPRYRRTKFCSHDRRATW